MTDEPPRERMERAIRVIRREGRKAALVEATVEAAAVLVAVDLLVAVVPLAGVPATVPVPDAVAPTPALAAVDTGAVAAVLAGLVVFVLGAWLRLRRPAVERFGAVNPAVAEALRTARDAVRADRESRMAARLYDETVERLRETSSLGLLDVRRVVVALVVVAVLAPASIGATATGFQVTLDGGSDATVPSSSTDEYEGLQEPSSVLGESEDVEAGPQAVNATVQSSGSGGNESREATADAYQSGFGSGAVETESQQAGFAEQERLEDAELVREYNLQIRQEDDQ